MRDPRDALARGVVLLTNDRNALGLAPQLSVTHNVSLASLPRFTTRAGWVRRGQERAHIVEHPFGIVSERDGPTEAREQ